MQDDGMAAPGERVQLHVAGLIQYLRVGVACVAGLGLNRAGLVLHPFQCQRARLAAGDAHGACVIPGGRAERAI